MRETIEHVLLVSGPNKRVEVTLSHTGTSLITPLYEVYEIHDPLYADLLLPLAQYYNGWLHGEPPPPPLAGYPVEELTGLQYHQRRLDALSQEALRTEAWELGYRGDETLALDEMGEEYLYGVLLAHYEQEEKES